MKKLNLIPSTKYNAEVHIPLLMSLFSEGKSRSAFCVRAFIGKNTFINWLEVHKDFAEAHEIALEAAQDWWEEFGAVAATESNFNPAFYKMTMVARFNMPTERLIKIKDFDKAKTHNDRFNKVAEEVSRGTLMAKEAQSMAAMVVAGCKVDETTNIVEEIKEMQARIPSLIK